MAVMLTMIQDLGRRVITVKRLPSELLNHLRDKLSVTDFVPLGGANCSKMHIDFKNPMMHARIRTKGGALLFTDFP